MSKPMTHADWTARAEAYQEAAEHLGQSWTDEARERAQGDIVAKLLQRESEKCRRIASYADTRNPAPAPAYRAP